MEQSYISPEQSVPELTIKAFILAVILTLMLTASTVYLGLKVGITISASIPAAVIAMGILGVFRTSNILENNMVQTAASGGMSLASGVIFCLPAMVILRVWDDFNYFQTLVMTLYGGILGVLFAVPFRRVLIRDPALHFPEGTAIGLVLQAKASHGKSLKNMLWGGLAGSFITLAQDGLKLLSDSIDIWFKVGRVFTGGSIGFSPVLLGAGYIIGSRTAFTILLGILIGWVIGIPVLALSSGIADDTNLLKSAMYIWHHQVRYIGVGVLVVGGCWTLLSLTKPFIEGLKASRSLIAAKDDTKTQSVIRTERDIPEKWVMISCLVLLFPMFLSFSNMIDADVLQIAPIEFYGVNIMMLLYTLMAGFVFSAICGYIVGLVGSSASPLSALALGAIIIVSLILLTFFGGHSAFVGDIDKSNAASTIAIMIGVVVICSAAITNDTIQDLKVGAMIGATPWKQQLMQLLGVVIAACIIPLVLQLLFHAYGMGGVYPREGMDPQASLAAPQAQLMASIAKGVFTQNVPWNLLGIGAAIAITGIVADFVFKRMGWGGIQVIAIGLGIYVPIQATSALVVGGLIAFFAERTLAKQELNKEKLKQRQQAQFQKGFILASGLIAGGAIMGILLAIPFVVSENTDVLALVSHDSYGITRTLGLLIAASVCIWLYRLTVNCD